MHVYWCQNTWSTGVLFWLRPLCLKQAFSFLSFRVLLSHYTVNFTNTTPYKMWDVIEHTPLGVTILHWKKKKDECYEY